MIPVSRAVVTTTISPGLIPLARQLALPPGVIGVDLAAIPDQLLNDQPAARLRIGVNIRFTSGLASVDAPSEIAWTESGYYYWLRSPTLSISQLIEVASALR